MKYRLLQYIRKRVGNYCNDSYWLAIIETAEHPVQYIHDNIGLLAINAIGTDSSMSA